MGGEHLDEEAWRTLGRTWQGLFHHCGPWQKPCAHLLPQKMRKKREMDGLQKTSKYVIKLFD